MIRRLSSFKSTERSRNEGNEKTESNAESFSHYIGSFGASLIVGSDLSCPAAALTIVVSIILRDYCVVLVIPLILKK